jgi:pyruvate/2-oxoacid:ferredoxin oxidoreductase beta subunit
MLSPCPTGWKSEPEDSVNLIDCAVRSGVFPLYEIFDGERYRINERPDGSPVEDYIARQRRYTGEGADPDRLRAGIEARWRQLKALETAFPADKNE